MKRSSKLVKIPINNYTLALHAMGVGKEVALKYKGELTSLLNEELRVHLGVEFSIKWFVIGVEPWTSDKSFGSLAKVACSVSFLEFGRYDAFNQAQFDMENRIDERVSELLHLPLDCVQCQMMFRPASLAIELLKSHKDGGWTKTGFRDK